MRRLRLFFKHGLLVPGGMSLRIVRCCLRSIGKYYAFASLLIFSGGLISSNKEKIWLFAIFCMIPLSKNIH